MSQSFKAFGTTRQNADYTRKALKFLTSYKLGSRMYYPAESINYGDYLVPLCVFELNGTEGNQLTRYAGGAFHFKNGVFISCKHIFESISSDEKICAKDLNSSEFFEILNLKCHPRFDFATFNINISKSGFPLVFHSYLPGTNVQALGFLDGGKVGSNVIIEPRLLKGYVTRVSANPQIPIAKSTLEVSFPSLKGFSGMPIITNNDLLVGMLYSNAESKIELHNLSEFEENGKVLKESIYRVQEFGLAHSITDILSFLEDLGINCQ